MCAVPVSVRGPPPQRYLRAKCAVPHCARPAPQSPDCVRVRSRPGPAHLASLRSAAGGGGPRGWHGRAGASARRSLCPRLPVRLGVRASSAHERHPAWSEYLPAPPAAPCRRCAHPATRARSGPVPRRTSAGALVAHVRFCGARSAPLTVSKGRAFRLIARRIVLPFIS